MGNVSQSEPRPDGSRLQNETSTLHTVVENRSRTELPSEDEWNQIFTDLSEELWGWVIENVYFHIPVFLVTTVSLLLGPCFSGGNTQHLSYYLRRAKKLAENAQSEEDYKRQAHSLYRDSVPDNRNCSELSASSAPVYLVTYAIDLLRLSESSQYGEATAEMESPLVERVRPELWDLLRHTVHYDHWAIVVRGITYELLRKKGSRAVEIKISGPNELIKVDAAGIPLSAHVATELGSTFLSDDKIRSLLEFELECRHIVQQLLSYDPLGNNCQFLWSHHLLRKIICQCPDQPRMRIPETAMEFMGPHLSTVYAHRVSYFVSALRKHGVVSVLTPWTAYSNIYVDVIADAAIYWRLWASFKDKSAENFIYDRPPLKPYFFSNLSSDAKRRALESMRPALPDMNNLDDDEFLHGLDNMFWDELAYKRGLSEDEVRIRSQVRFH